MLEFSRVRKDLATGRFREPVLSLQPESDEDKLDDHAAGELANALAQGSFDKAVDISGNRVTEQGLLRLTEVLGPTYQNVTCSRLVLRGNPVRNRGAHAVAQMLMAGSPLTKLDVSDTRITDDGLGYLAEAILAKDPLEELYLGRMGHHGLGYLVAALESSHRLRRVRAEFVNVTTLHTSRKTLLDSDFDYSSHTAAKPEGEEAGDEEEVDEAEVLRKKKKADQAAKWLTEDLYQSDDEETQASDAAKIPPQVEQLLNRVVEAMVARPNLESVELLGEHPVGAQLERLSAERQQSTAEDTSASLLEKQLAELSSGAQGKALPLRAYFRASSAISAALFECQRFKANGNAALATDKGEIAYVAMFLRQHLAQRQAADFGR